MKDNFSQHSDKYAQFRPTYPAALYDFIFSHVTSLENAWDCGTGTGQVAQELAKKFKQVYATDISRSQLEEAAKAPNISYSLQAAEQTDFPTGFFDLIVVAQAIHWFDFEKFYAEVRRTLKPDGLIAVIGYGLISVNPEIDEMISRFYTTGIGKYWDKERSYIDEHYQTIPFPFREIESPELFISAEWTLDHLLGYFSTWSAVNHFIKDQHSNPVDLIHNQLLEVWGNEEVKTVRFPVLARIGM